MTPAALGALALAIAPGFAVRRVEALSVGDSVVVGLLHGEPLDPRRHRPGAVVRAATMRRASVAEHAGRHEVSLIVH